MKRIFYFLAKKISYSAAIFIFTFILASLINSFEIPLLQLFFGSFSSVILDTMNYPYTYIVWISLIIQFIIFGVFTRIKIPALFKYMRDSNRLLKKGEINPDISNDELKKLYGYLNKYPVYNSLISTAMTVISSTVASVIGYTVLLSYGENVVNYAKNYIQTYFILHGFIVIISFILIYVLTDSLTSRERAACYDGLWRKNLVESPKSYLSLRVKFNTIIILMIIPLVCFILLIIDQKLYNELSLSAYIIYFLSSILAGIVIIFITSISIRRIFRDITRVAKDITERIEAKFHVLPLEREFADVEYLVLGMDKEILEYRKNLEQKVAERTEELRIALSDLKERDDLIQKQLDMAGAIQRGILPGKINDWNELRFSVKYFSMDKIGGDFYDAVNISANKLAVYIADASGHGIPAALVTTMAKVLFGNAFLKHDSPKKIFIDINQELLKHIKTQEYLTCFMVLIDDEYNITYSNASHQKGLILRTSENRIEQLDTGGLFLGAIETAKNSYEEKKTRLNYGDKLILFTDGIPEAINSAGINYSNERLENIIIQNKQLPLREFTDSIIEDLQNFCSGSRIQDDITLLVIELEKDKALEIIRNAKTLADKKKFFEAIDLLKKGLLQFPNNFQFLYYLAKSYFLANEFKQVVETINKYIQKEKENKFAFYLAGAAYFKMSDHDNAMKFFQSALNIDSNFLNALLAVAVLYKEKGEKEKATEYFEKIKKLDENNKIAENELSDLKRI